VSIPFEEFILNLPLKLPGLALAPASPRFINRYSDTPGGQPRSASQELAAGLNEVAASVSPKYFYDALGSKLFEAITRLDEYYPTRTEAGIFEASHAQMAGALASAGIHHPCLIDLGAGNCAKSGSLIPHLQPRQYVPVDISVDFLRDAAEQLQSTFPALDIVGIGMDFSAGLVLPPEVQASDRVFFYPGSSLGNFSPEQALGFLQRISDPAAGRAGGGLRRCTGRDRGLQQKPAAPCQSPARLGFRRARVAAPGTLQRGRVAHRDAPAGAKEPDGALARRRTRLPRR